MWWQTSNLSNYKLGLLWIWAQSFWRENWHFFEQETFKIGQPMDKHVLGLVSWSKIWNWSSREDRSCKRTMEDVHKIQWRAGRRRKAGAWRWGRMKKRKEKTKSSSPLYEGCYCLQMIPLPMYQHNMSAFGQEQSPFMAKVQPTVPLQCEDPTWGHDMLLHGQSLLCVSTYCTCITVAASFAWMHAQTYLWMPGIPWNPRFNAHFGFITFIVFGFTSFFSSYTTMHGHQV